MGYNTTVIVMNDAIGQLTDREVGADFAKKLHDACLAVVMRERPVNVRLGRYLNGAQVITMRHADEIVLLACGGNTATEVGSFSDSKFPHTNEAALEAAARVLRNEGWTVKPPKVKKS
jgi:hypothetical protein